MKVFVTGFKMETLTLFDYFYIAIKNHLIRYHYHNDVFQHLLSFCVIFRFDAVYK